MTSGATEGLFSTLTALVRPGDEVLLFQPAYDSYAPAIQLSGGTPVYVTLRRPDYCIDWDEVRRAITPRTRVILVNTPHNPTGMVLDQDDIRELERVLEHTDAFVVSDEVYEHIVFDGVRHESMARHPAIAERAVVISSFGKTYHTTGWKIGLLRAPQAARRRSRAGAPVGHLRREYTNPARVCRDGDSGPDVHGSDVLLSGEARPVSAVAAGFAVSSHCMPRDVLSGGGLLGDHRTSTMRSLRSD